MCLGSWRSIGCVGNDDDVRSMTTSETGALAAMKPNAILVDPHHNVGSSVWRAWSGCEASRYSLWLDAPVSGGQAGAENGVLTIMCGGRQALFNDLQPVFEAYGKSSVLMGKVGQNTARKNGCNRICIAGVLNGLSEGLVLAEKSGLDIPTLVDCLKNGAAGSWQMENRARPQWRKTSSISASPLIGWSKT